MTICLSIQTVSVKSQLYPNGKNMSQHIIIIDDDEAVRDSMCAFLECMGFDVITFKSAKHFIHQGSDASVCCFIVDVHMPEMTGVDFLELTHATQPELPIILVSGNISASIRKRAKKAGALAILEKPFEQTELLNVLKTVCPNIENINTNRCA